MKRTILALAAVVLLAGPVWAADGDFERQMREAQQKLNGKVLAAPFDAPEPEVSPTPTIEQVLAENRRPAGPRGILPLVDTIVGTALSVPFSLLYY